jgi:prolyl-tRNA synthetase
MAAIIETHHDDYGICWPAAVAPFEAHIVTIGSDEETLTAARQVYQNLRAAGFAVLLDDRNESAGVKFADADLIGAPVRLTVSKKALAAGGVETKRRTATERAVVSLSALPDWLRGSLP